MGSAVSPKRYKEAEAQVQALLQELLEQPALDPQASFFEQGGTSLKAVLLCARLQALWGTAIPAQLVFLHPRLEDLYKVLRPYSGTQWGTACVATAMPAAG